MYGPKLQRLFLWSKCGSYFTHRLIYIMANMYSFTKKLFSNLLHSQFVLREHFYKFVPRPITQTVTTISAPTGHYGLRLRWLNIKYLLLLYNSIRGHSQKHCALYPLHQLIAHKSYVFAIYLTVSHVLNPVHLPYYLRISHQLWFYD